LIKLTVLVARHPALSVEEFHTRWREHGRLIAATPGLAEHIERYEQHHRVPADYRSGGDFDGMALQWFATYEAFRAFLAAPEYKATLEADEDALLDKSKLVVIFTEEAEVFIP
jgi:heme-degrading monooxygenase HmoA